MSEQKHLYDYYIDQHGTWFCEGNPVSDPVLFRMLSRSLFEQKGLYFVRCEGEVHPVRVTDAPLWVRYVHLATGRHGDLLLVEIELQDGRKEALRAETLSAAGEGALYCLATARRLKARFAKTAYYELTRYLEWDEKEGRFYFVIKGRKYFIQHLTVS